MWLTFAIQNWKQIFAAALIAASFVAGYNFNKEAVHVQASWDKEKAEQAQAHLQEIVDQQNLEKKREATKNENLTEIDRLRANNHVLWLRLPKAPCTAGLPASDPPSDAASGVVHAPVSSSSEDPIGRAEQLVNAFKFTYSDEALRADQIVERCR